MQNIKEELGGAEWYFTSALWQPHTDDYVKLLSNPSFFTESNWEKVRSHLLAYDASNDIDAGKNTKLFGSGITGRDFSLYFDVAGPGSTCEKAYDEGAGNWEDGSDDKGDEREGAEHRSDVEGDAEDEDADAKGDDDLSESGYEGADKIEGEGEDEGADKDEDKGSDEDEDEGADKDKGEEKDPGGDGDNEEDDASKWDSATECVDF